MLIFNFVILSLIPTLQSTVDAIYMKIDLQLQSKYDQDQFKPVSYTHLDVYKRQVGEIFQL